MGSGKGGEAGRRWCRRALPGLDSVPDRARSANPIFSPPRVPQTRSHCCSFGIPFLFSLRLPLRNPPPTYAQPPAHIQEVPAAPAPPPNPASFSSDPSPPSYLRSVRPRLRAPREMGDNDKIER
jgi:transposase InsO family protein